MTDQTHRRAFEDWLRQFPSALTAYSGGVDSAVVAVLAHHVLGPRALACIGVSPSYPERERRDAIALAERLGMAYRLVEPREQEDPSYAANPTHRCYFCKTHLFGELVEVARAEQWAVILDGSHAEDDTDDRPGRIAASEKGVRSPLAELGIGKAGVRALARELGLEVWDKPAAACLASRVPHGVAITPELLHQIEVAEDALITLGFSQLRVRHHGDVARIEVPLSDFSHVMDQRAAIVEGVRQAGYKHVCLDLAGFRSGAAELIPAEPLPFVATRDTLG
jgi:uncharacterized protein